MARAYSYLRMSTELQLKGDSRRRQLEASERYASEHGLELQQDFRLEDIGVSAFKGLNVSSGALGQFLHSVKEGTIPAGSYLLVESLDRLSRQDIMVSLSIFTGLLSAGIHIATFGDGRLYKAGQTDVTDLIISLVIMGRAHDESVTKSRRLGAAWSNKRARLSHEKLTALAPAWLSLTSDRSAFVVDEERAATVREIYEWSAAGLGSYSIAKRLNEQNRKPFGRSRGWQVSYISKILNSRSVLGEFQPHVIEHGKRIPSGIALPGYFPQIVSNEMFNRVAYARSLRKVGGGGRRGARTSNLFSKIAQCGYCGAPMHFLNKGLPPKGGTYLVCDIARRGLGCERAGWPYRDFEASFLAFVNELDLETLLDASDRSTPRKERLDELQALGGQIDELRLRRERTYQLISGGKPTEFIRQKLADIEAELSELERLHRDKDQQLSADVAAASRISDSRDHLKALIARIQSGDSAQDLARVSVASRLKDVVEHLKLFSGGIEPISHKLIAELESSDTPRDEVDQIRILLLGEQERRKCFAIRLKGGAARVVYPDPSDPLHYLEIAERSAKEMVVSAPGQEDIVDPSLDWNLSVLLRSVGISNQTD